MSGGAPARRGALRRLSVAYPQPRLATPWAFNADATELTFTLRDDVTFHHGRAFTADDVIYIFQWVLDPDNPSLNRPLYTDIVAISAPDGTTVVFTLERPNAFLLGNIARMPIVPAHHGEHDDFQVNPVGTGPFAFVGWQRDDQLVLTAFDDYWGGPIGAELLRLEDDPSIGVDRVPAPSYNFIGFNTRAEPL